MSRLIPLACLILALPAFAQGTPERFSGELSETLSGVQLTTASDERIPIQAYAHPQADLTRLNPFSLADDLRAFAGHTVELEGVRTPDGLKVTRVLSPRFVGNERALVLLDVHGNPQLLSSSGRPLTVVGPLCELLRGAAGQEVEADLWLLGPAAAPTAVRVDSVRGELLTKTVRYDRSKHFLSSQREGIEAGRSLAILSYDLERQQARVWPEGATCPIYVSTADVAVANP